MGRAPAPQQLYSGEAGVPQAVGLVFHRERGVEVVKGAVREPLLGLQAEQFLPASAFLRIGQGKIIGEDEKSPRLQGVP